MKHSSISKKPNSDTGTFPLGDLSPKLSEKSHDIRPLNVSRNGMCEDGFQCFEMFPFHIFLVPQNSTIVKIECIAKGCNQLLFDRNVTIFEDYVLYTWRFPRPKHKGKKAAIVTASLAPFPFNQLPSQARGALRAVTTVLNAGGFDIRHKINVPLPPDPKQIGDRWLAKAGKLGREMGSW